MKYSGNTWKNELEKINFLKIYELIMLRGHHGRLPDSNIFIKFWNILQGFLLDWLFVSFAAFIESRPVGQYQLSSLHHHGISHMPEGLYCQSLYWSTLSALPL